MAEKPSGYVEQEGREKVDFIERMNKILSVTPIDETTRTTERLSFYALDQFKHYGHLTKKIPISTFSYLQSGKSSYEIWTYPDMHEVEYPHNYMIKQLQRFAEEHGMQLDLDASLNLWLYQNHDGKIFVPLFYDHERLIADYLKKEITEDQITDMLSRYNIEEMGEWTK